MRFGINTFLFTFPFTNASASWFKTYKKWLEYGTILNIFENSVFLLNKNNLLDTSITHGDGTTTMAKKGGDCLGFSGHKHMKGEKVVAIVD